MPSTFPGAWDITVNETENPFPIEHTYYWEKLNNKK